MNKIPALKRQGKPIKKLLYYITRIKHFS